MRYKKNLKVEGNKVYSYNTHVATISGGKLLIHGYWSVTTSKHVNHVADVYGLTKVKAEKNESLDEKPSDTLKSVAMVALMGNILGSNQKEKNDWKARMLKAGLEGKGLIMPEDWDTLDEAEKERRLDGAINELI